MILGREKVTGILNQTSVKGCNHLKQAVPKYHNYSNNTPYSINTPIIWCESRGKQGSIKSPINALSH